MREPLSDPLGRRPLLLPLSPPLWRHPAWPSAQYGPATATRLDGHASQLLEARRDIDGRDTPRHRRQRHRGRRRRPDLRTCRPVRLWRSGGTAWSVARLARPGCRRHHPHDCAVVAVVHGGHWRCGAVDRGIETADRLSLGGPLPDGSPSVDVAVSVIHAVVSAWGLPGVIDDTGTPSERPVARGTRGGAWQPVSREPSTRCSAISNGPGSCCSKDSPTSPVPRSRPALWRASHCSISRGRSRHHGPDGVANPSRSSPVIISKALSRASSCTPWPLWSTQEAVGTLRHADAHPYSTHPRPYG